MTTEKRDTTKTKAGNGLFPIRLQSPLHPVFVHFTIALTASSLVSDALGRLLDSRSLSDTGFWTMAGASLATLATILSGAISAAKAPLEEGEARSFLRLHMVLGFVFYGLLLAVAIWRLTFWQNAEVVSFWYLAAMAVVALVMAMQGYLGGELVYRYGLEVKDTFRRLPVEKKDSLTPEIFSAKKPEQKKAS
jgi:uncharacterized membrane protein